ncbi:sensor histidine kinase [Pseudoalteromonas luteoviolacea]|uniref:histidine kinase n=1 Tax=Pseudoalteromonas luteoviolacea (strain 2ta16) TaxID=1353533 RepID=V4HMP4_PSEL2|nr:HAMP domain-containing sensor histidine kinase [Pseudoalteromonas luteoviolacea]ESP92090.1 signal transduction histidine kinase [Pseudoalteromonas luteoviolacea 2ta16]KZN29194.1 hypothetical protein N483_07110 [Pseudoalteromonas luteoviolacea NCIMB 1944]
MTHFSLSQRIKLAYSVSFVLLSLVSVLLVFAASKKIEDHIFEKQLQITIAHYLASKEQGAVPYLPPHISVYPSISDLPNNFSQYINNWTAGVHELNHPNELDYHYAIINHSPQQFLVFLSDVNEVELSEETEQMMMQLILVGFLILLLVFLFFFHVILKRALAPMYLLIDQINARQSNPQQPISYHYPQDNELGLLVKTLVEYSQRIENFIRREREFTGFASHELRTPVTVIKGALSLLQMQEVTDSKWQKPLKRIERATGSMSDIIEMLLSLSREQRSIACEPVCLSDVLSAVIANFSERAASQGQVISQNGDFTALPMVDKIPAEIVMTNLLRNAIQHGCHGQITFEANDSNLSIINPINTHQDSRQSASFGLGSVIIQRICEQHQWRYQGDKRAETYKAMIEFQPLQANSTELNNTAY